MVQLDRISAESSVNLEKKNETDKTAFSENLAVFDQYFGMFSIFAMGVALLGWYRNEINLRTMLIAAFYMFGNLIISQISLRSKGPLKYEVIRHTLLCVVVNPLVLIFTDVGGDPFWQAYLISAISGSIVFRALTGKKVYHQILLPAVTVSFVVVNYFFVASNDWYKAALDMGTFILAGSIIVKLANIINAELIKERKNSEELTRTLNQLRQVQDQLVQTKKTAALGQMASGIAHEINNPLTVITTLASQVKMSLELDRFNKEKTMQSLERIESTVLRISGIISNLRTFSADIRNTTASENSVLAIIEDTLRLCQEKIRSKGVIISVGPISKDLKVFCLKNQISEVILNLLINAVDAIEKKDDRWIKITVEEKEMYVQISITDSGLGIPKENQEKIFQPFFSTKDIGNGMGMGLSIALGIMQNNYGSLVLNTNSSNTQFVLQLRKTAPEN